MAERKTSPLERLFRIEPGISLGQWAYDRIANNWDRLATFITLTGGMGYVASVTDWIRPWGALGIAAVSLATGCVVIALWAYVREKRAAADRYRAEIAAAESWQRSVDTVNPLAPEFTRQRLRVLDLAHPFTRAIKGKRLIDCELIGPANIFVGNECRFQHVSFHQCDIVVLHPQPRPVRNVIGLVDVHMIGGSIWNCTILIHQQAVPTFNAMGGFFITLSGDEQIDSRPVLPPGQ